MRRHDSRPTVTIGELMTVAGARLLVAAVVLTLHRHEEVFEERLEVGERRPLFRFASPAARHDVIDLGRAVHVPTPPAVGGARHAVAAIDLLEHLSIRQV